MNEWETPENDPDFRKAMEVLEGLAGPGRVERPEAAEPPDLPPAAGPDGKGVLAGEVAAAWSDLALRQVVESLPDAIVVINAAGTILLVNRQTEQQFGYSREELLGRPVEVLVPERFRREHVGQRQGFFQDPRPRSMASRKDLLARRRDGSHFPVDISLSPVRTDQGTLVTAAIRDVRQRKREEARLRMLVENIPAVTFHAPLDESDPELYVSPQIEQLLGFTQKEWVEDPVLWYRQLHPDDRETWNKHFAPTCAASTPFRAVYRFIAKDGRVVWVHGSANLIRDSEGKPQFLQGFAFDITALKEAEEERERYGESLRRMNAELDRRVKERTEALARSMAELQEKTEELEDFAYVASHDLREPLRTLWNYPQKLAREYGEQFDARAADWLDRIIRGAQRMKQLLEDLTQYSRLLRPDRTLEPVDCGAVAQDALAGLQAAVEESGAEVVVGELPVVAGNPSRLMLLFQNLLGNAIKFRDPSRRARVEVRADRQEGGWLFQVKDNGIGMEEKYLVNRKIFGLGERLHPASKYPGTGFGLAICEKIVTRHGGRIWATSEPGQGSTFWFFLPDTPPRPVEASQEPAPAAGPG